MSRLRHLVLPGAALWACGLAAAAELPAIAELPAPGLVRQALESHPAVRGALAGVAAGDARRAQLLAGPHEFEVTVGAARRREVAAGLNARESEIALQRAFRLPGKGEQDQLLGDELLAHARHLHGDALHETGRLLLASWFAAKREALAAAEGAAQIAIWREQLRITARRVALGDAAALEQSLVEAQLAQAEAQATAAHSRLRGAEETLRQHFPAIPAPGAAALPAPDATPPGEDWLERMLAENHELLAARSEARQYRINAQRAALERLPDPRLALRWTSERDGQEKLVGLQLNLPLPGSGRAAASRGASAEADAADSREAAMLAKAQSEARRNLAQVAASYRQWQSLEDAAQRLGRNAELLDKAWRIGEGGINDLINARRLAAEARLVAALARADAHEARLRLLLDAHFLWDFAAAQPG